MTCSRGHRREIQQANDAIYEAIHRYPEIIRLPFGETNSVVEECVMNMEIVKWNVDSEDWISQHTTTIVNKVMSDVQDRSIILFHDIFQETADAIDILIPLLIEEGYQLVTVSQLLSFENE